MPVGIKEHHHTDRIGWLRAAVLGANDGILSTSSLVLGVAAAHATHRNLLVAGTAGLVAGAMSMAAGEYVSVHSQADTEHAELDLERAELKADDKGEHKELAAIYVARGLDPSLAKQVAQQLMAHDALGAHASDELGISETLRPRPIQAALSSAGSFALGALMPLLVTAIAPVDGLIPLVSVSSLALLALLGGLAARVGGAGVMIGAIRVTFGWIGHGDDRRHRLAIWSSCVSRTNRKLPTGNGTALMPNWRWGNSDSHFKPLKVSAKVWLAFSRRIGIATGSAESARNRRNSALKAP